MKTTTRKISNVFLLISAIYQSVYIGLYIIINVIDYFTTYRAVYLDNVYYGHHSLSNFYGSNSLIVITIVSLVMLIFLALLWGARSKASHGSKGASIYGIVYTCLTFDVIGLAGYIMSLVDIATEKSFMKNKIEVLEKELEILTLQDELNELKNCNVSSNEESYMNTERVSVDSSTEYKGD